MYIIQKKPSRCKAATSVDIILRIFDCMGFIDYALKFNPKKAVELLPYQLLPKYVLLDAEYKLLSFFDLIFKEVSIMDNNEQKLRLSQEYGGYLSKLIERIKEIFATNKQ